MAENCLYNSEARLACGEKIPLCSAGIYDLELLSGVSDQLAGRILERRGAILRYMEEHGAGNESRALELVKGIGARSALKYASALSLEYCESDSSAATNMFLHFDPATAVLAERRDLKEHAGRNTSRMAISQ